LIKAMDGEISSDEGWAEIGSATLALARRQRTYFRRDPRIKWQRWEDDLDRRVAQAAEALGI
jgi:tRNA dimethylallyltransferase